MFRDCQIFNLPLLLLAKPSLLFQSKKLTMRDTEILVKITSKSFW